MSRMVSTVAGFDREDAVMVGTSVATLTPPRPIHSNESDLSTIPPYKVLLLDDPVTTMEFVVQILMIHFQKDRLTALKLMWEVHTMGCALAATLPLEQAELKQELVHHSARSAGFPFRCVIEPA